MAEKDLKNRDMEQAENRPRRLLRGFEYELTTESGNSRRIRSVCPPVSGHAGSDVEPGIARGCRGELKNAAVKPSRIVGFFLEQADHHIGLNHKNAASVRPKHRWIENLFAIFPDAIKPVVHLAEAGRRFFCAAARYWWKCIDAPPSAAAIVAGVAIARGERRIGFMKKYKSPGETSSATATQEHFVVAGVRRRSDTEAAYVAASIGRKG